MKHFILFSVILIILSGCMSTRQTTWTTRTSVPVKINTIMEKDSSITITTTWDTVYFAQTASSTSPLGLGYVPTLPEMSQHTLADANASVSRAMAKAIDEDPNNIKILNNVPNPANPNDQRTIIKGDFMGYPYQYSDNGRSVYYGLPGHGRTMPAGMFESYQRLGKKPTIW